MCGRFTMYADDTELVSLFDIDVVEGEHRPSYNQAPSELVRSVRTNADDHRLLTNQEWGFVPFWAKEGFAPLINARAETVTEKPAFRTAVRKRRCLVPTNGYYEWQKLSTGKKQPFFLSLANVEGESAPPGHEPVMAMAGIYEWPGEGVEGPPTCALLTQRAADTLGYIHDRMPLFIPKSMWDVWLDPGYSDKDAVARLIASIPVAPLAPREVNPAVGSVRNNFPGLIDPYDPQEGMLPLA